MTRKKPTTVLVFGILNLIFGPIALLCSMCCGVFMGLGFVGFRQMQQEQQIPVEDRQDIERMVSIFADNIPGFLPVVVSFTAAAFLLGFLKIIAGIGLVRIQSWGRWLGAICGLLIMLTTAGWIFYSLAYVAPAGPQMQKDMEEFAKKMAEKQRKMNKQPPAPAPMDWGGGGGNSFADNIVSLFFVFIVMGYGFLLFLFMVLPQTGTAIDRYHGKSLAQTDDAHEDNYPDHERQRRPPDAEL